MPFETIEPIANAPCTLIPDPYFGRDRYSYDGDKPACEVCPRWEHFVFYFPNERCEAIDELADVIVHTVGDDSEHIVETNLSDSSYIGFFAVKNSYPFIHALARVARLRFPSLIVRIENQEYEIKEFA